jgi:hypothetical protein
VLQEAAECRRCELRGHAPEDEHDGARNGTWLCCDESERSPRGASAGGDFGAGVLPVEWRDLGGQVARAPVARGSHSSRRGPTAVASSSVIPREEPGAAAVRGSRSPAPWGSMDIATMSLQMASTVNDAAPSFTLVAGRLVAGAFGRRCCGSSGASRRSPPSSTVRGGRRDVPRVSFARGAPLLLGSADQRIEQAQLGQTEHAIRGWRQALGFGFFPRDGCLSQDANVDAAAS